MTSPSPGKLTKFLLRIMVNSVASQGGGEGLGKEAEMTSSPSPLHDFLG